ncbi:MAG: hypothetical protein ACE14S_00590 [Candidatus Bathyarchaeia archaeon]
MSFRELAVTIRAVNRASGEFAKVSADAQRMSSQVSSTQGAMAAGFRESGVEASAMGAEVNAASTTVSMSMRKAIVDVDAFNARMKTLGTAVAGIGASGTAIGYIAHQFGLLNDEQARTFTSVMMVVTVMGTLIRTSAAAAVAQKVYAAATSFATMVQNSLNISFATFLALTGVGIAVIVAAAAAMIGFANSMNSATASVQSFNSASSEMPSRTRSIQRYGETETTAASRAASKTDEATLYRRGVE